jgi:hypothetical protein
LRPASARHDTESATLALDTAAGHDATFAATPALATISAEGEIPQYRTLMPPPMTLHYEVQRGSLRGTGDLAWHPRGDRYEASLEVKVNGLPVLTQTSSGAFDAAGLAPERYTDRRIGRSPTVANFQRGRDAGATRITFSGSVAELPLRVGTQDRLSWMLQLAAIVSAEPTLAKRGARVVLFVVGANGDASVWAFACVGHATLDARGGAIETVEFVREAREPADTSIRVWLDLRQHGVPVRALQKSGPNDEGYDLRLVDTIPLN